MKQKNRAVQNSVAFSKFIAGLLILSVAFPAPVYPLKTPEAAESGGLEELDKVLKTPAVSPGADRIPATNDQRSIDATLRWVNSEYGSHVAGAMKPFLSGNKSIRITLKEITGKAGWGSLQRTGASSQLGNRSARILLATAWVSARYGLVPRARVAVEEYLSGFQKRGAIETLTDELGDSHNLTGGQAQALLSEAEGIVNTAGIAGLEEREPLPDEGQPRLDLAELKRHIGLARGAMEGRRYAEAVREWSIVIEMNGPDNPVNVPYYIRRASAWMTVGKSAKGEADATKAIELQPDSVSALIRRAQARLAQKKNLEAQEDALHALKEDPYSIPARVVLIKVYLRQGNKEEIRRLRQEVFNLSHYGDPGTPSSGLEEQAPKIQVLRIAVVEDSGRMQEAVVWKIEEALEAYIQGGQFDSKSQVAVFGSAREAKPWIEQNKPQLVITDLKLTGDFGYEVALTAKSANLNARVILFKGESPEENEKIRRFRDQGLFDEVVSKWSGTSNLPPVIKELLFNRPAPNRSGKGLQVRSVEELEEIVPDLAAAAKAAKRNWVVLLPTQAVRANPPPGSLLLYTHWSVLEQVLSLLPRHWDWEKRTLERTRLFYSDDSPEEFQRKLEEATVLDNLEGRLVLVALDATLLKGRKVPPQHPVILLVHPETVSRIDGDVLAAFLSQPKALANLILDLTGELPIQTVIIPGQGECYAIFA